MSASEQVFTLLTDNFLKGMRRVECSQEEFLEGLKAALGEVETEIQACKETM